MQKARPGKQIITYGLIIALLLGLNLGLTGRTALSQTPGTGFKVGWNLPNPPTEGRVGLRLSLNNLELANTGTQPWLKAGPNSLRLAYRWFGADNKPLSPQNKDNGYEELRADLPQDIPTGGRVVYPLFLVSVPNAPGDYSLRFDLLQGTNVYLADRGSNDFSLKLSIKPKDTTAPVSAVRTLPLFSNSTLFAVSWDGKDEDTGSGLVTYDLQYKSAEEADWRDWLLNTSATSAQFRGDNGKLYLFRSRASDRAGNVGKYPDAEQASTRIDSLSPSARIEVLPGQSPEVFLVRWSSFDNIAGAATALCDVQYREGANGNWTDWQLGTSVGSALFRGEAGKSYFFRVRATDYAGNQGDYTEAQANTTISAAFNTLIAQQPLTATVSTVPTATVTPGATVTTTATATSGATTTTTAGATTGAATTAASGTTTAATTPAVSTTTVPATATTASGGTTAATTSSASSTTAVGGTTAAATTPAVTTAASTSSAATTAASSTIAGATTASSTTAASTAITATTPITTTPAPATPPPPQSFYFPLAVKSGESGAGTSSLLVYNPGPDPLNVFMRFNDGAGAPISTTVNNQPQPVSNDQAVTLARVDTVLRTVEPGQSVNLWAGSLPPSSFSGWVEVRGDKPLQASAVRQPATGQAVQYTAAQASPQLYLPYIKKADTLSSSFINLANTSPTPAEVTITYYDAGSGTVLATDKRTLPRLGSTRFSASSIATPDANLRFTGSAVISSNVALAASVETLLDDGTPLTYPAQTRAGQVSAQLPIYREVDGVTTTALVQNTTKEVLKVKLEYLDTAGQVLATKEQNVAGFGRVALWQGDTVELTAGSGGRLRVSTLTPNGGLVVTVLGAGPGFKGRQFL